MNIAQIPIGLSSRPFIIAELSGNHNQSIERSKKIIQAAASSGAQAIKLQTYTPDTMTLNIARPEFFIDDNKSPWNGRHLYELYEEAFTPWDWHQELQSEAHHLGLEFFSTPFDETAVDFLEALNVPAYKIASFENTDLPLIRKVATTGKPIIVSCGLISLEELDETVTTLREAGCKEFSLLKCTTSYPASVADSNIATIPDMRDRYGCEVGLSDHTLGIGSAVAAIAKGATIIEKHLTLRRSDGGVDASFSMEPEEFTSLVYEANNAWLSLGSIHYGATTGEKITIESRRSIYIAVQMSIGEIVTDQHLRRVRPGHGLPPKFYDELIGKIAKQDIPAGTPAAWELFE